MKKIIALGLCMTFAFAAVVMAGSLSKPKLRDLKQRPELREQMDKMILSMFDMDIMVHSVYRKNPLY